MDPFDDPQAATGLGRTEQWALIGQVASGMAHDLGNALAAVLGHAAAVRGGLRGDDPLREEVSRLIAAAEAAGRLAQRLLSLTRRSMPNPRPVALNDAVLAAEDTLRWLLGEAHFLSVEPGTDVGWVRFDPDLLTVVLVEIAMEAQAALPFGGQVCLATKAATSQPTPSLAAAETPATAHLVVVASGEHSTGDAARPGLSRVRRLIGEAGGEVTVEHPRAGCLCLRLSLPTCDMAS